MSLLPINAREQAATAQLTVRYVTHITCSDDSHLARDARASNTAPRPAESASRGRTLPVFHAMPAENHY